MKHVITDPSLEHLDSKLIAGFLIAILIGIMLSIAYENYEDKVWRRTKQNRNERTIRTPRPFRNRRKETVYA